jgi:hypothetical protein
VDAGGNRVGDHLEIPVLHPAGDDSQGEFYSIAIANNAQQADTGTKMVHLGKRTKSRIVSKGIGGPRAEHLSRAGVDAPQGQDSRNYTQCDSLLIGDKCGAHTVPYIEVRNNSSRVEHEATTSKVDDDQLFYCRSRGMDEEEAVALVVNGFCKEVLQALPMEFAMEAQALVAISLEGARMQGWFAAHPPVSPVVMHHADIGPTVAWGRPADETQFRKWPGYANSVWDRADFAHPDVVLVDGRFRAACLMTVALRITRPVTLLFDDYKRRKPYHAVEALVRPVAMAGRMARFDLVPMALPPDRLGWLVGLFLKPL